MGVARWSHENSCEDHLSFSWNPQSVPERDWRDWRDWHRCSDDLAMSCAELGWAVPASSHS